MASEVLSKRIEALEKQLAEYRALVVLPLPDPSTIYVGDGYFVTMTLEEARGFLNKKIENIEGELRALHQLGGVNEDGLPVFDIVEELDENDQVINAKVSQAGLGSIPESEKAGGIGASSHSNTAQSNTAHTLPPSQPMVARGSRDSLPSKEEARNSEADSSSKSASVAAEPADVKITENESTLGKQPSNSKEAESSSKLASSTKSDSKSELPDGSTLSSSDNDEVQYIEDISDLPASGTNEEDTSSGEYRDIDPADVLELELMEDENESGDIYFNFDDIEEEEEEDDDDDAFDSDYSNDDAGDPYMAGWKGGLFPGDEATKKLIQAHLAQQDREKNGAKSDGVAEGREESKKETDVVPEKAASPRVHFASSVDVREFETNAAERKFTAADPPAAKMSRFKITRQAAQPKRTTSDIGSKQSRGTGRTAAPQAERTKKAPNAALAAAAAVTRSPINAIHGSVVEREPPRATSGSPLGVGSAANRASSKISSPLRKPTVLHHPKLSPVAKQGKPQNSDTRVSSAPSSPSTTPAKVSTDPTPTSAPVSRESTIKEADIANSKSEQENCDDDAIGKDKIREDAERIFENSFVSDEDFLKLHDVSDESVTKEKDSQHKPEEAQELNAPPSQPKPLLSSVVEREPDEDDTLESFEDGYSDDGDNEVNMTEIKQEYQRLRQKLIYQSGGFKKKDSERAVELISDDGTPKKESRFKAARMS